MSITEITSRDVYNAAIAGDKLARDVFNATGKRLGESFADFVAFSEPEAIILFGGLSKSGHLIMGPIYEHMEKNLMPIWKGKVKLLLSALPEDDAAIIGAATF